MKKAVVYIHGAFGNKDEAKHYETIFENYDVIGIDYKSKTPFEAINEFPVLLKPITDSYDSIILIANSIGALFSLYSLSAANIEKAFFISPIVDMEKLIIDMLYNLGKNEEELKDKGMIKNPYGEDLSYEYLSWIRKHPIVWQTPTHILRGSNDSLQSIETIRNFAHKYKASLTVMEKGEHWFHTKEQMQFLDKWILSICQTAQ